MHRKLTPPSVKQAFCCSHRNHPVSCNVSVASGGDMGWNIAGGGYSIRATITVIHNIQSKPDWAWLSKGSFLPCRRICQRWPDGFIYVHIFVSFIAVLWLDSGWMIRFSVKVKYLLDQSGKMTSSALHWSTGKNILISFIISSGGLIWSGYKVCCTGESGSPCITYREIKGSKKLVAFVITGQCGSSSYML